MKNRQAGYLIIGISVLIGFIIYTFNKALTDIVTTSCSHGTSCPMWGTLNIQTNISLGLMAFVAFVGLFFVFFSEGKTTHKKIVKKDYTKIKNNLSDDEKQIFEKILNADGTIFQSNIVEETSFTKVKVTRILDKLEGRNLIERKRRGMTNVVILKH